jgi:hypothetical protein
MTYEAIPRTSPLRRLAGPTGSIDNRLGLPDRRTTMRSPLGTRASATVEPPTLRQLAALAGRYEMTLVNSEGQYGDSLVRGILVLWANDSVRRYMPRGA